ncbi:MAG TPA: phosphatase PAP2 family protein, partial [Dongiaceae bacterium]|nr:phosphatase PAP2 family protein [Dongiaceae bacterium]
MDSAAAPREEAGVASCLHAADRITLIYAALIALVAVVVAARIPAWWIVLSISAVVWVGVIALALAHQRFGGATLGFVHDWYVAVLVFPAFKELQFVISPLHRGVDYDAWFIAADRWLFGTDPTRWLSRFAHPLATEVLLVAYTSFYWLFLLAGIEVYARADRRAFRWMFFTCVYGFYLVFVGYLFLPAVGPRLTLHDYATIQTEPRGLWLTPYLRRFVDAGDSIPLGAPLEAARAAAQRDLFPSGHTMMSLVLIWCCF